MKQALGSFPTVLIDRIISSTEAQIVIDPFMGLGTTALSAKKLKRNFIGIDIAPEYCRPGLKDFEKTGRDSFQEETGHNHGTTFRFNQYDLLHRSRL